MNKFKSLLGKFWKLAPSLIFVFALCAIFSDATFAATKPPLVDFGNLATGGGGSVPVIPVKVLGMIAYVVKLIAYLAYVFALFVGNLMDSSFILDSGMGDTLHQIWVVMRNFVNIAFILVLLIIAVMVIFGGGGEKGLGMLKKVLPKFILALVLVNLTFFLARVVLTANDVLTTAIMTVPETIAPGETVYLTCSETGDSGECLKEITEELSFDFKNKQISLHSKMEYLTKLHAHKMEGSIDQKNIALVLTTYMLDLQNLIKIKALSGNWDALLGSIGAIIVAVVVGLVIFMLFLALMVRMVVLWIAIALSPLAALAMVLGDVIPGLNMKGDFDLLSIFLKHAFMPAMISLPLVIGLVMIFANNAIGYNVSLNTFFSFSGDSAADNLFSLLWWIASIIVIWYGTNMMIKKSSDYATKLTDKVHGGVNKFVGGAASTLQYVPFLPTENKDGSKGKDVSIGALMQIPSRVRGKLAGQASNRAEQMSKPFAKTLRWEEKYRDDNSLKDALRQAGDDKKKVLEAIKVHFDQNGTDVTLPPDIIKMMRAAGMRIGSNTKVSKIVEDERFLTSAQASTSEKAFFKETIAPALADREKRAIKSGQESAKAATNFISQKSVKDGTDGTYKKGGSEINQLSTKNDADDGKANIKKGLLVLEKGDQKIIVNMDSKGDYHKMADVGETKIVVTDIIQAMRSGKKEKSTIDDIIKNIDKLTAVLEKEDVATILNDAMTADADMKKYVTDYRQMFEGDIKLDGKGTFVE